MSDGPSETTFWAVTGGIGAILTVMWGAIVSTIKRSDKIKDDYVRRDDYAKDQDAQDEEIKSLRRRVHDLANFMGERHHE